MEKIIDEVEKYRANDGKIFNDKEDCIHHEKMLSGERKICPNCEGKGKVDPTNDGREYWTCSTCNGKKWVEKVEVWR